jgi:integrase
MTNNTTGELEIINLDQQILKRKESPKPPWRNARELNEKATAEFLTIEDIYNSMKKIKGNNVQRDRCLFAILYITAGRIGEIVRNERIRWGKKKVKVIYKGKLEKEPKIITDYTIKKVIRKEKSIKKSDITMEEINGRKILKIRMRNLKNKQSGSNVKIIPLPLDSEINIKFYDVIRYYINPLYPNEELFPIGKRRAEEIVKQTGFNPHFLRSCRLTHLAKYNNFSDQKLKAFAGWSDSRPAKHYIKIRWEDLVDSM